MTESAAPMDARVAEFVDLLREAAALLAARPRVGEAMIEIARDLIANGYDETTNTGLMARELLRLDELGKGD